MARRADWDIDDDFEVLSVISPSSSIKHNPTTQDLFELIEDDSFEITSCDIKQASPLINTTNPIQHVTISEQQVSLPVTIDKPIINEVKQSSFENSSYLPTRFGSAATIPHNQGFDLKSILDSKPSLPVQNNDLVHILQNTQSKKPIIPSNNNIQQILLANDSNRNNLVQIARKAQQDFLNSIYLD